MSCRKDCTAYLAKVRKSAKKSFAGIHAEETSSLNPGKKFFCVKMPDGEKIWEGITCCSYSAKANAIFLESRRR